MQVCVYLVLKGREGFEGSYKCLVEVNILPRVGELFAIKGHYATVTEVVHRVHMVRGAHVQNVTVHLKADTQLPREEAMEYGRTAWIITS